MAAKSDISDSDRTDTVLTGAADHRIKNSLSTISSLLRLQSRENDNPDVQTALESASNRILTIGRVHDHLRLLGRPEGGRLSLRSYLSPLLIDLTHSLGGDRITLLREIEDMPVTPRQASALGLIATEAISNAIRHAFGSGSDGGLIHVSFDPSKPGQGSGTLAVTDSGCGLPDGFDWARQRGMGGRIYDLYARSLGGSVTLSNAPMGGTRMVFSF